MLTHYFSDNLKRVLNIMSNPSSEIFFHNEAFSLFVNNGKQVVSLRGSEVQSFLSTSSFKVIWE